jgi:hypothetical protein
LSGVSGTNGSSGTSGTSGSSGSSGSSGVNGAPGPVSCPISTCDGSAGSPSYTFSADTNTGLFRPSADTIGVALGGTEEFRFVKNGTDGDFHATGDIIAYSTTPSDFRLKDNIFTLNDNTLELVRKIRPVSYTWKNKDNNKKDFGVIAQEIEQLLPEIVKEKELLGQKEGEKFKTVSYEKLIPFLIKAIQELSDEVDKLKKER